jgi:hypothetical protein
MPRFPPVPVRPLRVCNLYNTLKPHAQNSFLRSSDTTGKRSGYPLLLLATAPTHRELCLVLLCTRRLTEHFDSIFTVERYKKLAVL